MEAFNRSTGIYIYLRCRPLLYMLSILERVLSWLQPWGIVILHDISDCIYAVAAGSRGYHAPGWMSCYFLSCGILVLTLLWIKAEFAYQTCLTIAAALAAGMGIFLFAPLEDKNKPLEEAEKKVIGKKARIIVVTELILGMVFLAVNQRAAYAVWAQLSGVE